MAKNRHKRCGQNEDSLEQIRTNGGEKRVSELRVMSGTKMIRHKPKKIKKSKKKTANNDSRRFIEEYRAGDLVLLENGDIGVVRASNHKGYSILLWGKKDYVIAAKCKLVRKNTGIVCVASTLKSKSDWHRESDRQ